MRTFLSRFTRRIRAEWRDLRVLLNESRVSLWLFVSIVVGGATIFHWFYTFPGTNEHPPFALALYGTFGLIFFEGVLPFPDQWYLQPLFFIIPILGLAAVLDGVGRFGSALLDKQARGQKWQVAMASTFQHHIIICGLGKTGYRTALELLRFQREVVAVESNENGRFVEQAKALGIPVLIADARRSENLTKAGVTRADAIIPCTDDELTNLDIALDARELNPSIKVVLRMFDPDLARRVEKGFGIRTALSTSALAAPIFAAAAMRIDTQYSFYVGEQLLNLSEIQIEPGATLVGWTVDKLEAEIALTVVGFQHGALMDVHPHPMHELHAGDKILVLAAEVPLKQLNDLAHAQVIY
jgi:voltage-gated potassium channel